jgi:hypothetical protein
MRLWNALYSLEGGALYARLGVFYASLSGKSSEFPRWDYEILLINREWCFCAGLEAFYASLSRWESDDLSSKHEIMKYSLFLESDAMPRIAENGALGARLGVFHAPKMRKWWSLTLRL